MIKVYRLFSLLVLSSYSLLIYADNNSALQGSSAHHSGSNPYINKDSWAEVDKQSSAGTDNNSQSGTDNRALIGGLVASIQSWRQDWESLDTDRYLLNYSVAFHNGIYNYKQWSKRKKTIIGSKNFIRVGLEDVRIQLSNSNLVARVTFRQDFLSDSFADESRKLQYWMKIKHNKWHIISERTMPEKVYQYSETNSLSINNVFTPAIPQYSMGHCTDHSDCIKKSKDKCAKGAAKEACLARK